MPRIQGKQRTPGPKGKSHRREAYLDWAVIALFNNAVLLTIALIMPPLAILLPVSLVLGLGFAMGAITVLHNAGHHRYSQRYWPNMLAVHSAVPVGLWVAHWTLKHRIHHRLPAAYPDDAFTQAGGMLRLHPLAPHRPFHRFQHVYAWFMYPLAWAADMQSQLKVSCNRRGLWFAIPAAGFAASRLLCHREGGRRGRPAAVRAACPRDPAVAFPVRGYPVRGPAGGLRCRHRAYQCRARICRDGQFRARLDRVRGGHDGVVQHRRLVPALAHRRLDAPSRPPPPAAGDAGGTAWSARTDGRAGRGPPGAQGRRVPDLRAALHGHGRH